MHDIRYYLNGILFVAEGKNLTLVATDGHRLRAGAGRRSTSEIPKQEVILPRKTVLELQRLLRDEKEATRRRSRCASPATRPSSAFGGMEFVSKLVEGKFPDYNRVIPKNHKNAVTLGRAPLLREPAARRDPDQRQVQGRARQHRAGHAAHRSSNAEQEEAEEELEIDYGGDAIEIGFNVTYLIDALTNMSQDMVDDGAAGHQLERADHRARQGRLQVRRDADAHLSDADSCEAIAG